MEPGTGMWPQSGSRESRRDYSIRQSGICMVTCIQPFPTFLKYLAHPEK
jgi:hypothetical protein